MTHAYEHEHDRVFAWTALSSLRPISKRKRAFMSRTRYCSLALTRFARFTSEQGQIYGSLRSLRPPMNLEEHFTSCSPKKVFPTKF